MQLPGNSGLYNEASKAPRWGSGNLLLAKTHLVYSKNPTWANYFSLLDLKFITIKTWTVEDYLYKVYKNKSYH